MKAADVAKAIHQPDQERIFRVRGEGEYSLEVLPAGITLYVGRLRRSHQETVGELSVTVNGNFPKAKSVNGLLSRGNFNFSSFQTRGTLSKTLADRSQAPEFDWHGFLEEFACQVLDAERKGAPSVILADEPDSDEGADTWDVEGWPLLRDLPMVLFGKGEAAKSLFAMWVAGTLASRGIPVLYADWEFSRKDHRRRFAKLFNPMPRDLHYVSCDKPMREDIEHLKQLIQLHRCQYLVCDSVAFALEGNVNDSQEAGSYFRLVRQLQIGSLHIAHTTKSDDDSEKQVIGSVFFQNGARSIWFVERANENPVGTLRIGLYHRKNSIGERLKPLGFQFTFLGRQILVKKVQVEDIDDLAAKLPLLDRMKRRLRTGAMSVKALAEATEATAGTVRKMVSKYGSVFIRVGDKIGLLSEDPKIDF